ncbi:hypothetical protein BC826DRAFT_292598 [Russula brevipes]|nr:hypothetical protein BC826DRAFT_292598 [Russula brevipes]
MVPVERTTVSQDCLSRRHGIAACNLAQVELPSLRHSWNMEDQLIYPFSTDSEDENNQHELAINEHYAKAFQYRKEREELTKLKEKYGSDADTDDASSGGSDSESDESEDEDGEELTPALDAAILRTLARIKARDPVIYDAGRHVFDEEHGKSGALPAPTRAKKAKAPKPVTLPEHRLAAALDIAASRSASPEASSPPPPTHVAEQAALRAETVAAFHSSAGAGDAEQDEEGGLFTLREKTRDEVEREEAEYRAYLEREAGPLEKILDLGERVRSRMRCVRRTLGMRTRILPKRTQGRRRGRR